MAQVVKLKRTAVSGKVPSTSNLELGELAINTYDGKIYFEKDAGTPSVESILTTNSTTTGSINILGSVTASYFTGDGSNLTFGGTEIVSSSQQITSYGFISASFIDSLNTFTQSAITVTGNGTSGSLSVFSDTHTVVNSNITTTTDSTTIVHSNDGNIIFTVSGSNGELLTVTDSNSGNLLEVNDTSGIDVFTVSAVGDVSASGAITASGIMIIDDISVTGNISGSSFNGTGLVSGSVLRTLDGTGVVSGSSQLEGFVSKSANFTTNEIIISDGTNSVVSTDLLTIDPDNNRVGVGTSSPSTKFHIAGEGANEGQIRLQQANNGGDGPDIAFYSSRGTIASPSAVQGGDTHGRINAYPYNGTSFIQAGSFGWSGTDGTGNNTFDIRSRVSGTLAKRIEITSAGKVKFNDSYEFPTSDGSANQILQTDGSGVLSFSDSPTFTNLVLTGNLTVQGTTTTTNTNQLNVGDNIIELNYGGSATEGGIYVKDSTGASTTSGSLLWDSTNDYWKLGKLGSESEVITTSNIVTNLPSGVISGSTQLPSGVISGSAQLLNVATDFGSGRVSGESIGDVAGTTTFTGSFVGSIQGPINGSESIDVSSYTLDDSVTYDLDGIAQRGKLSGLKERPSNSYVGGTTYYYTTHTLTFSADISSVLKKGDIITYTPSRKSTATESHTIIDVGTTTVVINKPGDTGSGGSIYYTPNNLNTFTINRPIAYVTDNIVIESDIQFNSGSNFSGNSYFDGGVWITGSYANISPSKLLLDADEIVSTNTPDWNFSIIPKYGYAPGGTPLASSYDLNYVSLGSSTKAIRYSYINDLTVGTINVQSGSGTPGNVTIDNNLDVGGNISGSSFNGTGLLSGSNFATTGSNNFTGNQTITGSLSTSGDITTGQYIRKTDDGTYPYINLVSDGEIRFGLTNSEHVSIGPGRMHIGSQASSGYELELGGIQRFAGDKQGIIFDGHSSPVGGNIGNISFYAYTPGNPDTQLKNDNNGNFVILHNERPFSGNKFKIDSSGNIHFNDAYKFPTSDGSANQVLQTDGSGVLSFGTVSGYTDSDNTDHLNSLGVISGSSQIVSSLLNQTVNFGTGEITASYFSGDGSGLTNVNATISENATVTSSFDNLSTISVGHNFDTKNVIVSVYNDNDSLILPQEVNLTDENNLEVILSSAQSGFVVVAKGGHVVSGSAGDASNLNGQVAAYYLNYNNFTNIPGGLISGSSQVLGGTGILSSSNETFSEFSSSVASDFSGLSTDSEIISGSGTTNHIAFYNSENGLTSHDYLKVNPNFNLFLYDSVSYSDAIRIQMTGSLHILGGISAIEQNSTFSNAYFENITATSYGGDGSNLTFGGTGLLSGSSQITDLTTYKETVSGNSSYTITHNLNEQYPIVQAWNTNTFQQEISQTITTNSANQVSVEFATTFAGVIIVKK